MKKNILPVLLAGGLGTRLWPLSNRTTPKQFIRLLDDESLFEKTLKRALKLPTVDHIYIIASEEHRDIILGSLSVVFRKISTKYKITILYEPTRRSTAPALITAALHSIQHVHDNNQIISMPCDHLIDEESNFIEAVQKSSNQESSDYITLFGLYPENPNVGFGYITADNNGFVEKFHEKPTLELATDLIKNENCFWNSGIFSFSNSGFIEQANEYCPEILQISEEVIKNTTEKNTGAYKEVFFDNNYYSQFENISVDKALMEKSKKLKIIKSDFGWSDIGNWKSYDKFIEPDRSDNRIDGNGSFYDSSACTIKSSNSNIVLCGLKNVTAVENGGSILVLDKKAANKIGNMINSNDFNFRNNTVQKPWGSYQVIFEYPGVKIKILNVNPQSSLSLQSHEKRDEYWQIISGEASIIKDASVIKLEKNGTLHIPPKTKHRISNNTDQALMILETQTGDYLEEDDIIRYEDIYNRV